MPNPFLEERISAAISYGSSWSDGYEVRISETASEQEYRWLVHPYPRRRFRLIFRADRADVGPKVKDLYDRAFGRLGGFRAWANDDNTTAANGRAAPTKDDHQLLYVSAGVYQLRKEYGKDKAGLPTIGRPWRIIYKPIAGSVLVAKNGVLLSSGVTVDTTTGRVTISPAPSHPADVITGGCRFDIPVRFDTTVNVDMIAPNHRDLRDVELVELLAP